MNTLNNYLANAKEVMSDADLVIMGNEAADLDSMASAISYGYFCSLQSPDRKFLPLMPIARADFHLRTEAVFVMQEAGINSDDLVFFDEVDFGPLMAKAELVLVDHNLPSPGIAQFNPNITGIIDHHHDEGEFLKADPRIIQTIGSTTSIIAEMFFDADITISTEVAVLLGGTILLDTVNLDDKAGRVTEADKAVAAKLLPLCPLSQQKFFDKVQEAKFSVQGLSTNDLLRKDYKEWIFDQIKCGVGSALLPIEEWAQMDDDLATGFDAYCKKQNLNVLLSMNAFTNPDFHRHLVIFCKNETEHDKLLACLQANGLDLKPLEISGQKQNAVGSIHFYQQGNLGISRKKIQPILAAFFK